MKRKLTSPTGPKLTKLLKIDVDFDAFIRHINKSRNDFFTSNYLFNEKRVRKISQSNEIIAGKKAVVYWMSRDQRLQDNWALIYSQKIALKHKMNLHVCFCLVPKFLDATIRHYDFLLKGLEEVEKECRSLNINFHLLLGSAVNCLPEFIACNQVGVLVTDFSPLRLPLQWLKELSEVVHKDVTIFQVDAHNVVPCWIASPKLEVGARTIRSKINNKITEYLTEFPPIIKHPNNIEPLCESVDWGKARRSLEVDMTVTECGQFKPGALAALNNLLDFVSSQRLVLFNTERNNPTKSCLSNLSPWLHFGQIAPQRCILEARLHKSRAKEGVDIFVEEALVRRELADNFCFYNDNYDNIKGASLWAQETLAKHGTDKRPYEYTLEELTLGKTHDKLWNGAQLQMVRDGKMHGFLRMYWAKKILEWTGDGPEEALRRAIWLNDRYSLDGRDPNGYTGIMWSICGVHDQGWKERDVFGKVRYMNYKGCERKFDVRKFEDLYGGP